MKKALLDGLINLRNEVEKKQQARRDARLAHMRESDNATNTGLLRSFQPAADSLYVANTLHKMAASHTHVFKPMAEFGLPDAQPTTPPLLPPSQGYVSNLLSTQAPWLMAAPAHANPTSNLPPATQTMVDFFTREINEINDTASIMGSVGGVFVPKLKSALAAFQSQRFTDVQTILKSALKNEPHNPMLLFLLAQFAYFQVGLGHLNALPEGRETASKAMNFNEKIPADKLAFYRYHCIAAEMLHDAGRAVGWMRDFGLLNAATFKHAEGLWVMNGLPLQTWALLAQTNVEHWHETEFANLKDLAMNVVGGGFVYLLLFRDKLIEAALARKDPFPSVMDIDSKLAHAYQTYLALKPALEAIQTNQQPMVWLVPNRYFQTIMQAAPLPAFEHILLNIALDAEHWNDDAINTTLRHALHDPHASYWRLWAQSLAPDATRSAHPSPMDATHAVDDAGLISACNALLQTLRQVETSYIKTDVWGEIQPWLIRWQLDHFLAAGTGNSHPREGLMPKAPLLRAIYRRWSQPAASGLLASDIIHATAQAGAFGSIEEVLAAFEGAYRLIDDPNHGLVATQKRALQLAKGQNPSKFSNMSVSDGGGSGNILAFLIPLVALGGIAAIFSLSQNMGQAIGLVLALAGVLGVMLLGMAKGKAE